jgi:hypothetical protein
MVMKDCAIDATKAANELHSAAIVIYNATEAIADAEAMINQVQTKIQSRLRRDFRERFNGTTTTPTS